MRYIRSKLTGEVRKQYSRYNGTNYVFLELNQFWETV